MTMDNLAQAKEFLRQADALADQAHALLDPIARVAIDSKSAIEIRRVAELMPPGFHRSELRVIAGQLERGEIQPAELSTVGFR